MNAAELLKAAAQSPLGLLGLTLLLLSGLAFRFFDRESVKVRASVFAGLFLGAAVFIVAVIKLHNRSGPGSESNLEAVRAVTPTAPEPTPIAPPASSAPLQPVIEISARDFVNGTNVAIDQCTAGPGILANAPPCNAAPNAADFLFESARGGTYQLDVRYAADSPRPVQVILNGQLISDQALSQTTGGWDNSNLAWVSVGPVTLSAGSNRLRLVRSDVFPHIHDLRLVPTPND
jgi:hypothetical protein